MVGETARIRRRRFAGRRQFERVLIFRPHNVYGPDMGFDHVIPQFAVRLKRTIDAQASGPVSFDIQGSGEETRSFCHVDDLVQGVMVMREKGEHLNIYHVGTTEEVSIADLARRMAAIAGREIALRPSAVLAGSTPLKREELLSMAFSQLQEWMRDKEPERWAKGAGRANFNSPCQPLPAPTAMRARPASRLHRCPQDPP